MLITSQDINTTRSIDTTAGIVDTLIIDKVNTCGQFQVNNGHDTNKYPARVEVDVVYEKVF